MKILFFGDIVGRVGRAAIKHNIEKLVKKYQVDFVIANGENVTHGKGLIEKHYYELIEDGINCITLGNHFMSKNRILDYIDDADSCNEIENLYNDYILAGDLAVVHDNQIYKAKYSGTLAEWIFSPERKLGDKTLIENSGTFYVVYYVSESPNPEWYDRVNSFLRMNNYRVYISIKSDEYTWEFHEDGLAQIKDVP